MIYNYNCLRAEFGSDTVAATARLLRDSGIMTDKQYIVFRLYFIGHHDVYEISGMLGRDKSTISRHLQNVYNKLYKGLHNL